MIYRKFRDANSTPLILLTNIYAIVGFLILLFAMFSPYLISTQIDNLSVRLVLFITFFTVFWGIFGTILIKYNLEKIGTEMNTMVGLMFAVPWLFLILLSSSSNISFFYSVGYMGFVFIFAKIFNLPDSFNPQNYEESLEGENMNEVIELNDH